MLNLYDTLKGIPDNSNEYKKMKVAILVDICKERELPFQIGGVETMRKILKLHESVAQLRQHDENEGNELRRVVQETDAAAARIEIENNE